VKKLRHPFLLLVVLMTAACAAGPGVKPEPSAAAGGNETIAAELFAANLDKAQQMMLQGKYPEAIAEFRKLMDYGETSLTREEARMGLARCFMKIENFAGALKTLRPFPQEPKTENDRHRLALAGEVLLRDDRPEEAETLLEIAMVGFDKPADAYPSWAAACCENLGCAYLKNGKFSHAIRLYQYAADLYRGSGRFPEAREAEDMAGTIETLR